MHLCQGLKVNKEKVEKLLSSFDYETVARNLGHDVENYDHLMLAGRLLIESKKNVTPPDIETYCEAFADFYDEKILFFFLQNKDVLNKLLQDTLFTDLMYDWVSANVMYKTYTARSEVLVNGVRYEESPRFWHLRVASYLYQPNLTKVMMAYHDLCSQYILHATPTNINAGRKKPQPSSCFLLKIKDSLEDITLTGVHKVAQISKHNGGLGIDVHEVRHSNIKHAGMSQGLVSMIVMFNYVIRYVNQCFAPGSKVMTSAGMINIEDILPGQEVLTRDGTYCKVVKVLPHALKEEEKMYKLTTPLGSAKALGEHPMLSLRPCASLPANKLDLIYTPTRDLSVGDNLFYPLPLAKDVDYSEEELYIYGSAFASGRLEGNSILLPPHEHTVKILCKMGVTVELTSDDFVSFKLGGMIRITPNMMKNFPSAFYSLPEKKALSLYEGLKSNLDLFESKYLQMYVGQSSYVKKEQGYLVPILGIEEETSSFVYDLEVDKNHNFTTEAGLAHNGGRRKGAATIYTRPHHIDIVEFVELNQLTGDVYSRAHDIDLAVWTSWLFWKRVEEDGPWSLFCPALTKSLNKIWGVKFAKEYERLEKDESVPRKTISARKLLDIICTNQQAGGRLYTLNGDGANQKSNQKNLGYISHGNLCLEVIQYSSSKEIAACNLAQISLSHMVEDGELNYDLLSRIARRACENLNAVIDRAWFPFEEITRSNKKHRPMGIGVSGFAEMLHKLDLPFEDPVVKELNKKIFACIYFNALAQSISLSIEEGMKEGVESKPYDSFAGSPASEGKFQFDLWAEEFDILKQNGIPCNRKKEDDLPLHPSSWGQKPITLPNGDVLLPTFEDLRRCTVRYGWRNSLLIALMPTATSSIVLRNCESVEAHQTNIYSRKLQSGNYPMVNRFLIDDLTKIGLWNLNTVQLIQADEGSVSKLDKFVSSHPELYPEFNGDWKRLAHIQKKYKTMWEIPQPLFIKLAADRARYVCQSQSTNLYFKYPKISTLIKAQKFAFACGLKTLVYYIRQQPAVEALKITVSHFILSFVNSLNKQSKSPVFNKTKVVCTDEVCISCQ
ncbi:Ribonucleoside-diphosphate reductase large chain [Cedratvirus Zaza IHUMI]|uniref:Ribonucleoside-diphosphate reductase n=1 Tax=Cedratvirus Zaza IHUMI TaxID=2126979 RepID=A0A2R8FDX5_9VIRU|nr:Ribonucleoside-diphosphate reductase large chain [Cedratvirus Zaza IHUMI]